jgi:hypothetical protein
MQIWKHKYSQLPQNPNFVLLSELMLFLGVHQVVVLGDRIKLVRLSVQFWCLILSIICLNITAPVTFDICFHCVLQIYLFLSYFTFNMRCYHPACRRRKKKEDEYLWWRRRRLTLDQNPAPSLSNIKCK